MWPQKMEVAKTLVLLSTIYSFQNNGYPTSELYALVPQGEGELRSFLDLYYLSPRN